MELSVFIEAGCELCIWALATVSEIRRRFPDLKLTIVDISKTEGPIPDAVFAVPTYILNGKVVSLGNPDVEDLDRTIRAAAKA